MRLSLIISSILFPLLVGAYMADSRKVDTHKPALSSNIIDLRERTKSSIDEFVSDASLSSDGYTEHSEIHPQVALSPLDFIPDSDISTPLFQLEIGACGNQAGNANLRVGNQVIGIISAGTIVDLTGTVSDEWVEVSGAYWPTRAEHPTTGRGWVHQCWLTPESMVIAEPENNTQTEPLGLLSRRGGRSFRSLAANPIEGDLGQITLKINKTIDYYLIELAEGDSFAVSHHVDQSVDDGFIIGSLDIVPDYLIAKLAEQ